MPYIKLQARKEMDAGRLPKTIGELNYLITVAILDYLKQAKMMDKRNSYKDYNEVIGVLECAKQEIYRRLISPYEDKKIKENGDVFEN